MHASTRTWIAAAILFLTLPPLAAAQQDSTAPAQPRTCPAGQTCPMGPGCPAGQQCPMPPGDPGMQARHQAMMQQHAADATRIQELQDRMHAATGDAKIEAMEALLDELLAQHRAMHERMMGMHPPGGMMPQGMEHGAPDD